MHDSFKIAEYNETAAALAILREKYCIIFDVTTTKGMNAAKEARAEVKGYRVALEKVRKEIKAPALERSRLIDEEAKRITAELLAIEEPIDEAIKAEERRKEDEKAAKAKAEATRLATIAARMSALRNLVGAVANQPAAMISAELEKAQTLELSEAEYQEFMPDAIEALNEARKDLQAALNTRLLYEAEQARIKAEQDAEAARMKAEREAQEAELKAKREAMEAEFKAQRAAQEQQEREARQAREAEEARLNAEREAMEQQRAELEALQRKLEEAEQAKVAKLPRKDKATDPLADLKQALNANAETAKAIDEAYQRGFQAGLSANQGAIK